MTPEAVLPEMPWLPLSALVADSMGLHFPRERWPDLQRGLAGAAAEFGFDDAAACAHWLLSAPLTRPQLQALATHLTIGETYFFREKRTFEALAASVLPALIASRRGRDQRLRLWSAGCCSGEEAYSLAILLRRILPDLADWHVTILATDISARFLKKAVAGIYGEWSFRDAPPGFKEQYFSAVSGGRHAVLPEIRKMVTFSHLNLAEDAYPSLPTETTAMDLIFCRNVLMYFTPAQMAKVIANLHRALAEGGWLAVSPSEVSQMLFSRFATRNFPGAILYQKNGAASVARPKIPALSPGAATWFDVAPLSVTPSTSPARPIAATPAPSAKSPEPYVVATALYQEGRYAEAADALLEAGSARSRDPRIVSLLARAFANEGRLAEALTWCDRWLAADKLDAAGHYLRAIVLLEQGASALSRESLQRTVYLEPGFILAHYALGNLSRSEGRSGESEKHFANARRLLTGYKPDDLLPESDGLTAGRLSETIAVLTAVETVR